MNNLENLVPPPELCKLIPEGKFVESALVFNYHKCGGGHYTLIERRYAPPGKPLIPAPTLQEIMDELVCLTNEPCLQWNGGWHVSGDRLNGNGRPETYRTVSSVTAAMKLWLEVEGLK